MRYGGNDPFEPYYLCAYVNPFTNEVVRMRLSRASCDRAVEALRGQGVTQMHTTWPEYRAVHEHAVSKFKLGGTSK